MTARELVKLLKEFEQTGGNIEYELIGGRIMDNAATLAAELEKLIEDSEHLFEVQSAAEDRRGT